MNRPKQDIFWAKSQAEAGRRVRPVSANMKWITTDDFVSGQIWLTQYIFGEWEVERKPEVVECELNDINPSPPYEIIKRLTGKRWKAVFTEVIE